MEKISKAHEDYLETIVMLGGTPEISVRSVDIATKMGVSKPSVNKAITVLKESNLLDQPFYGDITLTQEGYDYGNSILERHNLLFKFLTEELGLDKEVADVEACQMEHAISDESFEKWISYIKNLGHT